MKIPDPPEWWPKDLTWELHYRATLERLENALKLKELMEGGAYHISYGGPSHRS